MAIANDSATLPADLYEIADFILRDVKPSRDTPRRPWTISLNSCDASMFRSALLRATDLTRLTRRNVERAPDRANDNERQG